MSGSRPGFLLHVDDDEANQYIVGRILARAGFRVVSGSTGEEALRIAADGPDLIILDVKLPDIDGLEVCRRLKADPATAGIPVLHLSAHLVDGEDKARGLDRGADAYLVQPVEPPELVAVVRALLRSRDAERELRLARDELTGLVRQRTADLRLSEAWSRRSEAVTGAILQASLDAIVTVDHRGRVVEWNPAAERTFGRDREAALGLPLAELILPPGRRDGLLSAAGLAREWIGGPTQPGRVEIQACRADGTPFPAEVAVVPIRPDDGPPLFAAYLRDITERVRADRQLREGRARLRAILDNCRAAAYFKDTSGRYQLVSREWCAVFGKSAESVEGKTDHDVFPAGLADTLRERDLEVMRAGEVLELEEEFACAEGARTYLSTKSPVVDDHGAIVGVCGIATEITERKRCEEEARHFSLCQGRRLERIDALRRIDESIAGGNALLETLGVVLEQAIGRLGADAAAVLLPSDAAGSLEYATSRGLRAAAGRLTPLAAGTGRVIDAVEAVRASDLATESAAARWMAGEGIVTCHAAPLIAQGRLVGVIEVYHRSVTEPDAEWLSFLEALARQAAIAVDNATLLEGLRRSNLELQAAYDDTIEGWARALDLRDKETEGHSRRVTEMTIRLARAMGLTDGELVDVRRGALLHDIGKMGIPDSILMKPGKLTDEEWAVMKRHPTYALEMLWPIEFLRPAVDIPYCHHEKWDGTGYPRGLAGDQIPLAARIFAAVDIWDALGHDRPYRSAWTPERVRAHIESLSGNHLDPRVVSAFLRTLDGAEATEPDPALAAPDDPAPRRSPPCSGSRHPADPRRLEALDRYRILDTPAEPSFDDAVLLASHICGAPMSTISLVAADRQWFKARVGVEASETPLEVSFCAHAIRHDGMFVVPDASADCRFAANPLVTGEPGIRFYAGFPLVNPDGFALGTLCVIDRVPRRLAEGQLRALESLARQVVHLLELRRSSEELRLSLAAREEVEGTLSAQLREAVEAGRGLAIQREELARANEHLAVLATTDPMTGLKNVRQLRETLRSACSLASRKGAPASLILLDVDEFKSFNDTFGHLAGDDALRTIASLLSAGVRDHDLVARYGGEEFALLLPATERAGALAIAERIRESVALHPWPNRRVTISLGVATTPTHVATAEEMLAEADRALYHSKRTGRNRVTHHDATPSTDGAAVPRPHTAGKLVGGAA